MINSNAWTDKYAGSKCLNLVFISQLLQIKFNPLIKIVNQIRKENIVII